MMYIYLKRIALLDVACENNFPFLQPTKPQTFATLFNSCFFFAAVNQESLSVVQVTLIKMRGQSVESLHQVRKRLLSRRVCVWALNRGLV